MFLLTRRTSHFLAIALCLSVVPVSAPAADLSQPEIEIRQLPRSEFDVQQRGAVSIAYEMVIRNRSQQAITLREVTMKRVGRSPYVLKNAVLPFTERIEASQDATVTFSLWAYSRNSGQGAHAMVWARGSAQFESDGRTYVTKFSQSFRVPD
ncbi:MAG: hypothetical protein ACXW28_00805 [Thermoanaerobaculia bacterium]